VVILLGETECVIVYFVLEQDVKQLSRKELKKLKKQVRFLSSSLSNYIGLLLNGLIVFIFRKNIYKKQRKLKILSSLFLNVSRVAKEML
jgi:oligoendopeptidase F